MKELKKHVLFQNAPEVKEFCSRLSHLSIDGYIFCRRFKNGKFVDLSNQLDWSLSFFTRCFQGKLKFADMQDNLLIQPGVSLWSDNPNNGMWEEGSRDWGFHSGISIAKEGPSWIDFFCFYSRKRHFEMNSKYLKNFYLLEKFNLNFVEQLQDIVQKGERNPLEIPKEYLSHIKEPSIEQKKFLKSFNQPHHEPLTERELECIYYAAKGNSALQIGQILHISKRTVETHLGRAKDKLFVTKTSDLIKFFPEW